MGLVILLSLLIVAAFVALCYMFNESRVELDSPTIAAMEAHTEALEAKRRAEEEPEPQPEQAPYIPPQDAAPDFEPPAPARVSDYEYREMLEEGGGNYVLPQWIVNFFSSSDICHTLDRSDNVIIVVKLSDAKNAETGIVDIYADCDMTTQTVALKLGFGEGASAETFQTKFYLFERGDLFELGRLVRQQDIRIDVLTRGADYTLEYAGTVRAIVPHGVLSQLKDVLKKIPA